MDKIFIWWYCKIDSPQEMLKHAQFHLIEAKTEDEAMKMIDDYIDENKYCSYACGYKEGKISIGMMETNYVCTSLLEYDRPINEGD